jgi:hypothetical protein
VSLPASNGLQSRGGSGQTHAYTSANFQVPQVQAGGNGQRRAEQGALNKAVWFLKVLNFCLTSSLPHSLFCSTGA